ncbi:MAG: PQQ-dependent sugar dehydrogenase [Bacteroidota bacterium]
MIYRWFLISCCLYLAGCAATQALREKLRATTPEVLVLMGEGQNAEMQEAMTQLLPSLATENQWKIDTTTSLDFIHPDTLQSYGALVLFGVPGENLSPYQQKTIERYVQSGAAIGLIHSAINQRLTWHWLEHITQEAEDQVWTPIWSEAGLTDPIFATDYDGGRLFKSYPTQSDLSLPAWQAHLSEALSCAIGDNLFRPQNIHSVPAPKDNRFTFQVLDADLNEPMELAVMPSGKILFTERRGTLKMFDPAEEATHIVAQFDVCTQGNYEDGLMGITLDPKFKHNGYLYVYYSPIKDCEIEDQYLSRFTMRDDSLIMASEKVILKVKVQRESCCHSGGGLTFGPDGCLYLSTGDNTISFESDGFSPIDEREGHFTNDAQKSSGNAGDLRGKILRIKPHRYGIYTIPEGNLFPRDGSQGRPEIYAMGCRNPFRFSVDPKTGVLYWGDVGPDGGKEGRYGPKSFDEFNRAPYPGNFGWPYFIGNNRAYRDRDFAMDTVGNFYDPEGPINCSPNNTGPENLPMVHPAWIWYSYDQSDTFPMLGKGSRCAMAGPIYYDDLYPENAEEKFPAYYNGKLFIYEWGRGWIKLVTMKDDGTIEQIEPFLPDAGLTKPIEMEFGPDGAMYILDYGKDYFLNNPEAKLVRIAYARGNRPPEVTVTANATVGESPMDVYLDASQTMDFDEEDSVLRYEWVLEEAGGLIDSGQTACFTLYEPGIYHPQLRVIDHANDTIIESVEIMVRPQHANIHFPQPENQTYYFPGTEHKYALTSTGQVRDWTSRTLVQVGYGPKDLLTTTDKMIPADHMEGYLAIESSDCYSCHNVETHSIGPSYRAVAKRYAKDGAAIDYLANKIINGGGGNWGEKMMAAHPQLSQDATRKMVRYILSLNDPLRSQPTEGKFKDTQDDPHNVWMLKAQYEAPATEIFPATYHTQAITLVYPRVELETYDWFKGVKKGTRGVDRSRGVVYNTSVDAYIGFNPVDFTGIQTAKLHVKGANGGQVQLRLNTPDGPLLGTYTVPKDSDWQEKSIQLPAVEGLHSFYMIFKGKAGKEKLGEFDWIEWGK